MAVFKCKMCGGNLEVQEGMTVCECEYCGSKQTVPQLDDEKKINLFTRANRLRSACEFDKASGVYESLVSEFPEEAEAYWGLLLCQYGIEYVDDTKTGRKIPTCHRSSFDSIMDEPNFEMVLECSDPISRAIYREEAKAIEVLRNAIIEVSSKEEPYDIFICYKETDIMGERTIDSVIAQDVYDVLTEKGYKVFFSRITLESKLGEEYEPYIFAALNSAKVMLAFGTDYEHYNAVWVKNEWSRFLNLIEKGEKKTLIPCFKDIDAYDMPKEFARLQAQDMGKVGAIQDLLRGVEKIIKGTEPAPKAEQAQSFNQGNTEPLLKRAQIFLEDKDWKSADEYCEKVLDLEPENCQAYIYKLMAKAECRLPEELKTCKLQIEGDALFDKIIRYANEAVRTKMLEIADYNAKYSIYKEAIGLFEKANIECIEEGLKIFEELGVFEDASTYAVKCRDKIKSIKFRIGYKKVCTIIENQISNEIEARSAVISEEINSQIQEIQRKIDKANQENVHRKQELEQQISSWRNQQSSLGLFKGKEKKELQEQIDDAQKKIRAIPTMEQVTALYQDEINQTNSNKEATIKKITAKIRAQYKMPQLEDFEDLWNNTSRIEDIYNSVKKAASMANTISAYKGAAEFFESINGYRDSASIARTYYEKIERARKDAIAMMDAGNFLGAYESFIALDGYKDSVEKAASIYDKYIKEKLKTVKVGDCVFFGTYEQGNNTSNGKEDIEWLVLDKKDGKALLISKYGLDCKAYNEEYESVTWETCTLRKWLNSDFIKAAFSDKERAKIPTVTVSADENPKYDTDPGKATQDKVFLLSITEANKYFNSDKARQCKATDYAEGNGAYFDDENDNCWWWLRSPGDYQYGAASVGCGGDIYEYGLSVRDDFYAVRPALWIDLDS